MRRIDLTDEELRAAHAAGKTWISIARKLDCNPSTIRLRAATLGLRKGKGSAMRKAMTPAEERRHSRDCARIVEILHAGGLESVAKVWG